MTPERGMGTVQSLFLLVPEMCTRGGLVLVGELRTSSYSGARRVCLADRDEVLTRTTGMRSLGLGTGTRCFPRSRHFVHRFFYRGPLLPPVPFLYLWVCSPGVCVILSPECVHTFCGSSCRLRFYEYQFFLLGGSVRTSVRDPCVVVYVLVPLVRSPPVVGRVHVKTFKSVVCNFPLMFFSIFTVVTC